MTPEALSPAQRVEIRHAIEGLSGADSARLESFARFRMRALGGWARGQDWRDLMNKALTDTLQGVRSWDPDRVSFVNHLLGAMRSISTGWRSRKEQADVLETELEQPGEESSGQDVSAHRFPTEALQERQVYARERLRRIEKAIEDDDELQELVDCIRQGFSGPETRELMDWSERQFQAAVRRLRRRAAVTDAPLTERRIVS